MSEANVTQTIETSNPKLASALEIAAIGLPVFPVWHVVKAANGDEPAVCACGKPKCGQVGKHPRCWHGHNDATTDEALIRSWWSAPSEVEWESAEQRNAFAWQCDPDSNIGIAIPDGLVIVDVDPRNGGDQTLAKICAEHGSKWLESLTVKSGGGGLQVYFACEPGRRFPRNLDAHFGKGIDLKQNGGYVLAPESNHKSGGIYAWHEEHQNLEAAPAWLVLLSKARTEGNGTRTRSASVIAPAPAPDASDLDEYLRERLDKAIEVVEPFYTLGSRHSLAQALGGYCRNRELPASAAEYLISQLPSTDPAGRVAAALWAYGEGVKRPAGASQLPADLLRELDALNLYPRGAKRTLANRGASAPANDAGDIGSGFGFVSTEEPAPGDTFAAVDRTIERLADRNVYQRSGVLVRVTRDAIVDDKKIARPKGAQTIRSMPDTRLAEMIAVMIEPEILERMREEHDSAVAAEPDETKRAKLEASWSDKAKEARKEARAIANWQANVILKRGEWTHVRALRAIVTYPCLRPDGSILNESGYDHATQTLAELDLRVDVAAEPTQADARAAFALLEGVVCDFPFEKPEHRSAWVAFVLTIVARPAIAGSAPMFVIDANVPGAGKGKLVDAGTTITLGERATARAVPKSREEWDKTMTTLLGAGDPVTLFDNVKQMIDSDSLELALTTGVYAQRALGGNDTDRKLPVRTIFAATCNNATVTSDLVRRAVCIRLNAGENPEQRSDFKHTDLLEYVRANRAELLGAALTIVRAYALAGRPKQKTAAMGSFEEWSRVVRDAVVWAGGADCVETQAGLREEADIEHERHAELLREWHQVFGDRAVTVGELVEKAYERVGKYGGQTQEGEGTVRKHPRLFDALSAIMPNGADPKAGALGYALRRYKGKILSGLMLKTGGENRDGARRWHVVKV